MLNWFSLTTDTSQGLAIEKICEMLLKTAPILVLVKLSAADMGAIFLERGNLKLGLGIGTLVFCIGQVSHHRRADDAQLTAEIIGAETDIAAIAARSAAWTAENIAYDERLAWQIWNGLVDSQSALATLEKGQGTCSEYTNLFIAIMRSQGIPARFVTGVVYEGGYHAWPEFYLYGVGWIPVEAQGGFVGTTPRHIKLFAGRDFADIGVKLRDIRVDVQPLTVELEE